MPAWIKDAGSSGRPVVLDVREPDEHQIARVAGIVADQEPTVIMVRGQRKIGTTSLLHHLSVRLGAEVVPVVVEMQTSIGATESAAGFLHELADVIVSRSTARTGRMLPYPSVGQFADDPYPAFNRWLDRVEIALGGRRLLLCLDEFDVIDRQLRAGRLDTRVLDLLRSLVLHRRQIQLLLAGSTHLAELSPAWASALGSTVTVELGPLEAEEAVHLLLCPEPGFPAVYTPSAVDAILGWTARHPFLVQVMGAAVLRPLVNTEWHARRERLTADDVTRAIPEALDRAETYLLDVWQTQVPSAEARGWMRLLAAGRRPAVPEALTEDLLVMHRRRIVTRGPDGWRIEVPLFAQYIRDRHSI